MKRHSESEGSDGGGSSDKQLKSIDVIRAPISEPNVHDKKFPFFRRPRIIGSFSVDANRKFVPDRSQMRFFCPERLKNSAQAGPLKLIVIEPHSKDLSNNSELNEYTSKF